MVGINDAGDKLAIVIPLDEECIISLEDLRGPFEEIWRHTDTRLPALDIVGLFLEIGQSKDPELKDVYTLRDMIKELTAALELAGAYLGKAVADDLMQDCVRVHHSSPWTKPMQALEGRQGKETNHV